MITNENYSEYESEVLQLLKDYLKDEGRIKTNVPIAKGYGTIIDYFFLDLVVYDSQDKIKEVYKVCTPSSYETNLITLQRQLQHIQSIAKAEALLAFKSEEEGLRILSLLEVGGEILRRIKAVEQNEASASDNNVIDSFVGFYNKIRQFYGKAGFDQRFFFRGHSDADYKPIPSVYRDNTIQCEEYLYHEAVRRLPGEFTEDMTAFDNLVKMQHYELPTRLLDVTSNPLVALYFACQEDHGKDGSVLVFPLLQNQIKYYDSDAVSVLANLAKRPVTFVFEEEKSYLVYDIQKYRPTFDGKYLKPDAIHEVFCVMPKLNNNRIIKQEGAFFIFGMGETKDKPAKYLDDPQSITIKAEAKQIILKELDILGINEASLFPETDKVMKQIRKEFVGRTLQYRRS